MEHSGRRNRRGRRHSFTMRPPVHNYTPPEPSKQSSCLSSCLIMASLLGVIYFMLEHHCTALHAKYDLDNISQNIGDMAKNLSIIHHNYYDLETKIAKFSYDLPKIEGQIEILDALARNMGNLGWETGDANRPQILKISEVDVILDPLKLLNISEIDTNHGSGNIKTFVDQGTD